MDYTLMSNHALEEEITNLNKEIDEINRILGTREKPIGTVEECVKEMNVILEKYDCYGPCHHPDGKTLTIHYKKKNKIKDWFQERENNYSKVAKIGAELRENELTNSWMKNFGFTQIELREGL